MGDGHVLTEEEVWRTYDRMEARLTAPLSERMLDLAGVKPGMRILDLATGRGEPAIAAAHRAGPSGSILGIDLSASMLAFARERADQEGVTNLDLRAMDATSAADVLPAGHFDATLVRWGLMYMTSPIAALSAARRAMVPAGLLVAAAWTTPECATYYTFPRRVLANYRLVPQIDLATPGPFYYADLARMRHDFESAGLRIEHAEELDVPVMEARTADDLVAWVRAFGLARLLADLPESAQRLWEEDLVRQAEPLRRDGYVRLGGVTRIVVARSAASKE